MISIIAIRQPRTKWDEEDPWILIAPEYIDHLIERLLACRDRGV